MKARIAIIAALALLALTGCGPDLVPIRDKRAAGDGPQLELAKLPISRIAGQYLNEDGIKTIIVEEVFSEDGWNGRLSFVPGIGDWAKPVRCRISGSTTLAVEIPAKSGRVVIAMFTLVDPKTIQGEVSPWQGTFKRTR